MYQLLNFFPRVCFVNDRLISVNVYDTCSKNDSKLQSMYPTSINDSIYTRPAVPGIIKNLGMGELRLN